MAERDVSLPTDERSQVKDEEGRFPSGGYSTAATKRPYTSSNLPTHLLILLVSGSTKHIAGLDFLVRLQIISSFRSTAERAVGFLFFVLILNLGEIE